MHQSHVPSVEEMAAVFMRIRAAVYYEATRPSPYGASAHCANQLQFKECLKRLCEAAQLRHDITIDALWWHVWTKIRYAGFKAAYVTREIEELKSHFNDFRAIGGAEWYFGPTEKAHGDAVREFLTKTGRFADKRYSRMARKLRKILSGAAAFRGFSPNVSPLISLFGEGYDDRSDDAFWRAHARLANLTGCTTALHVMMDIGFNCVKPDIVLVGEMCRLGWIHDVLPADVDDRTIHRKYCRPDVIGAVIKTAREVAAKIEPWHPESPLREFDFVMVKYGQRPGECGIIRCLDTDWCLIEKILEKKFDPC